jgi:hypothetical protein
MQNILVTGGAVFISFNHLLRKKGDGKTNG